MKIVVFKYGEALYSEKRIFADVHTENKIPMAFCFYLIQKDGKNILVDVGCKGKERYQMYAYREPADLLAEYGLQPADITDVIITHAHFDHTSEAHTYPDAVFHIQAEEYQAGKQYLEGLQNLDLFENACDVTASVRVEKYGGHTPNSCIVFAENYLLCGDECYFQRNLDDAVRVGNSAVPQRSQEFVETYRQSSYIPLLFHDGAILSGKTGFAVITE